ncbi:MAG TPA: type II toxin-antitoxin system Phd/YefM family antitoxin [Bdellovibrionota bacterium]|nr:type II toxin-antitoxin system Phd/YefM family antitoxin [Bdellovibrionota bacterium]
MKNIKTIIPVSELQSRASAVIEQVRKTRQPVVVTLHGRGAAAVVDLDFFQGTIITNEEKEFPDWEKRLERAERETRAGRAVSLRSLKAKKKA